jgi:peroxiredoxin
VSEETRQVEVGSAAPEFRLPASTGGETGLDDYRNKSHVVLFLVREYR